MPAVSKKRGPKPKHYKRPSLYEIFFTAFNGEVLYLAKLGREVTSTAVRTKRTVTTRLLLAVHPESKSLTQLIEVTFTNDPTK